MVRKKVLLCQEHKKSNGPRRPAQGNVTARLNPSNERNYNTHGVRLSRDKKLLEDIKGGVHRYTRKKKGALKKHTFF